MDWIDLVVRLGLPTALLTMGGWFLIKHVWPFVVKTWETTQAERVAEREKFLSALDRHIDAAGKRDALLAELSGLVRGTAALIEQDRSNQTAMRQETLNVLRELVMAIGALQQAQSLPVGRKGRQGVSNGT